MNARIDETPLLELVEPPEPATATGAGADAAGS